MDEPDDELDADDDGGFASDVAGLVPPGFAWLPRLIDDIATRVANRPARVRVKVSPQGLLAGQIDVVVIEVRSLPAADLLVDRIVVRAEKLRLRPGIPPRIQASPLGLKAVVSQRNVDRWTHATRMPVRLELTEDGVVAHTGLAGIQMGEVLTELTPSGPFLQLRPIRASVLGLATPLLPFLRGYLPLPPLPAGAHLDRVEHGDGELAVYLALAALDEPLVPDLPRRLRDRLRVLPPRS